MNHQMYQLLLLPSLPSSLHLSSPSPPNGQQAHDSDTHGPGQPSRPSISTIPTPAATQLLQLAGFFLRPVLSTAALALPCHLHLTPAGPPGKIELVRIWGVWVWVPYSELRPAKSLLPVLYCTVRVLGPSGLLRTLWMEITARSQNPYF